MAQYTLDSENIKLRRTYSITQALTKVNIICKNYKNVQFAQSFEKALKKVHNAWLLFRVVL